VATRPLKPLPLPQDPVAVTPPARAPQAAPDPAAAAPADGRLPVWPLVDDELYRKVNGDLDVNVHVYSKIPEERFVFLNMKIYREGDRLLEGPRLEQITQDGVILSLGGERFRVPAR
jgi:general secretion pathway protein B